MHDTWHKIHNHSSQSCLCNKQIQSSIQIHKFKFKFELGFLLTVSNPFTNSLLDPSAIILPCPELLSLWELPPFQLFNSNYFQLSWHQTTAYCPSIQLVARSSRIIGPWCKYLRHDTSQCLHRPVERNERVRPDALNNHRETHQFFGPCCLCLLLTTLSGESHFTEAAMYVPICGRYAGEYVAECAKSHCGYKG